MRLHLVSAAAADPFSTTLGWPIGGFLSAVAEDDVDDDTVLSSNFEDAQTTNGFLAAEVTEDADGLEHPTTDVRRFVGDCVTGLLDDLTTDVKFGGGAPPMLGLARRGTGSGLVLGFRDLVRDTFAPPRLISVVEVAGALVVVRRAAALAVLVEDDTESQLDTDVLAAGGFILGPTVDFVTINCLP